MKKTHFCFISVVVGLSLLFSLTSCSVNSKKVNITQKNAQAIAETVVKNDKQSQIINYSAPEIVEVQEKHSHKVCPVGKERKASPPDLKGKPVWRVKYKTGMDGVLGPITVYIDYYSGKIYGMDLRF